VVGVVQADVAVVGAGLAGTATALLLARRHAGARIVLVEAARVGAGATGQSTGVMGPGVGSGISQQRRVYGDAGARRIHAATEDAVRTGLRLIADEAIDCELRTPGQLVTALTPRHVQRLRRQAAAYAELGFDVPWLDRDAVAQQLGSDAYLGGIRLRPAAVLDPYRLVKGLAERAVAAGVQLFEASPVLAAQPGRLTCPRGQVRAATVVLATDAGTAGLGVLDRRVQPIDTHVLRTGHLPAGVLPGGTAVIDARNFFHYYRPTADGRLVFGGGPVRVRTNDAALEAAQSERIWRRLEDELRAVFPALADVPVTDRWYGRTGATLDRMPVVGPLRDLPGAWAAVGWSGHGIALSLAAAHLLAEVVHPGRPAPTRLDNNGIPWLRGTAPALPALPGRRIGIAAYLRWLDVADRAGLALGGRGDLTPSSARRVLAGAAR